MGAQEEALGGGIDPIEEMGFIHKINAEGSIYQQDIAEVEAQLEQNYKMLRRLITKLGKIH